MVATDPGGAVADIKHRLSEVEGRIVSYANLYATGPVGGTWVLGHALPVLREQVRLARVYRDRLATAARLGGPAAEGDGEPAGGPATTEMEEVHAVFLAAAGQRFINEVRAMIAPTAARLKTELDEVDVNLGHLDAQFAGGNHAFGGSQVHRHDAAFARYAALTVRRQDLAGRIASLDQDATRARGVQAGLTTRAIEAAGGQDAVAGSIREAWTMADRFWHSHPGHAGLVKARGTVEAIEADLARLGGADARGSVVDQLKGDRKKAAAEVKAKQGAIEAEVKAGIAALIEAAASGDEPARAEIERAARSEPRAFPAGFLDAIVDAQFERSQIGASVLSMLGTSSAASSSRA